MSPSTCCTWTTRPTPRTNTSDRRRAGPTLAALAGPVLAGSVLAGSVLAGCTAAGPRPDPPAAEPPAAESPAVGQPSAATTAPAGGPGCAASGLRPAAYRAETDPLLGTWVCRTSTTLIEYTFSADGTYRSRENLSYRIPLGWFRFERDQAGTATVGGGRITLRPTRSTRTRTMPEDPGNDYTDRPEPLTARSFTYRLDAAALHLRDDDRVELILPRAR